MLGLRILFIIMLSASYPLHAQQTFQFAQYQQTALFYNPAFSGIEDFIDVKMGYRKRWSGLDSSPSTGFVSGNMAFNMAKGNKYKRRGVRLVEPEAYHKLETGEEFQYRKARRNGAGIGLLQNENGNVKEISGFLSYAYHIPISDYIIWSMGASGGIENRVLDTDGLTVTNPINDPTYQGYLTEGGARTETVVNLGTVLYAKKWYVGYSANRASVSKISNVNDFGGGGKEMTHVLMVGISTNKPGYAFHLMPGAMVEYSANLPVTWTVNLRLKYEDAIWGGLAYRSNDAAHLSIGMYLSNNIAFNYAFEYPLSKVTGLNASTHEIILSIKLNNKNYSRAFMW